MPVVLPPGVGTKAAEIWVAAIDAYGRPDVFFKPNDGGPTVGPIKAFCSRPKILGLFDRTEQSYDQTRWMVSVKVSDFPDGVDKFDRIRWDDEDHAVLSQPTPVRVGSLLFGYRILVKG